MKTTFFELGQIFKVSDKRTLLSNLIGSIQVIDNENINITSVSLQDVIIRARDEGVMDIDDVVKLTGASRASIHRLVKSNNLTTFYLPNKLPKILFFKKTFFSETSESVAFISKSINSVWEIHESVKSIAQLMLEHNIINQRIGNAYLDYLDGHSLNAIAEKEGVTKQRAMQLVWKGKEKIRNHTMQSILHYASLISDGAHINYIWQLEEQISNLKRELKGTPKHPIEIVLIEDLDLSVRLYNCLKTSKLNNTREIYDAIKEIGYSGYLKSTRNMGWKSMQELISMMLPYGFEITRNGCKLINS